METAIGVARPGGAIGRVGVPQEQAIPASLPAFFANVTIGGGPAPVRAYIAELLPDILDGRSSRVACSTAPPTLTASRPAIAPWPTESGSQVMIEP